MYGMLASGLIDIVVEDTLKAHDYMALIPVIEGAGGVVTDKNNKPINLNSSGSIIASASIDLHKQIFEILKEYWIVHLKIVMYHYLWLKLYQAY